jgi:DNA-binding HxlR family transcriptional regulator
MKSWSSQNWIVTRHDFGEVPPRVEYALTPLGIHSPKLLPPLDDWVIRHYHDGQHDSAR